MDKLTIRNLDPEQAKFFTDHLLQMGLPFKFELEDFPRPQPSPPAPAANAATAQSNSAARATPVQLDSQAVVQDPMEGRPVFEQRNEDENQEDRDAEMEREAEQEKVRLARKWSIDQPPDPATSRQGFQDMGINVSYGSPSDAHREAALPPSASKHHSTPFGNPELLQAGNEKILLEHEKGQRDSVFQPWSPKNTTPPPSSNSSSWNVATIFPKPEEMAKPPIDSSLVTSEQKKTIISPKLEEPVIPAQPPVSAEKKMQESLPKVEEQKPSQFPQKKKKWTEQDEQDLDECGGVLVDMVYSVDDPASRSISTSNVHDFVDLRVTNPVASQSDSGGGLTRLRGRMQDLVFHSTIPTRSPLLILNLETRYNTTVEQFTARQTNFQNELRNAGREEPSRNVRETEHFRWGRVNYELQRNNVPTFTAMSNIVARRTNEANRDVPKREPCTRVSDADIDTCDNSQIRPQRIQRFAEEALGRSIRLRDAQFNVEASRPLFVHDLQIRQGDGLINMGEHEVVRWTMQIPAQLVENHGGGRRMSVQSELFFNDGSTFTVSDWSFTPHPGIRGPDGIIRRTVETFVSPAVDTIFENLAGGGSIVMHESINTMQEQLVQQLLPRRIRCAAPRTGNAVRTHSDVLAAYAIGGRRGRGRNEGPRVTPGDLQRLLGRLPQHMWPTMEQREAVINAVNNRMTLLDGPPGVGKSRVVVLATLLALSVGMNVLATAKTNTAVNMLADNVIAHAGETSETTEHGVPIFATQVRPIRVTAADYDTSRMSERVRSITDQERLPMTNRNAYEKALQEANLVFSTTDMASRRAFDCLTINLAVVDESSQLDETAGLSIAMRPTSALLLVGDRSQMRPYSVLRGLDNPSGYLRNIFMNREGYYELTEHFRGDADASRVQQRHYFSGRALKISGGVRPLPENARWPGWKQTNPFCFVHVEGREQPGKIRLTSYDNPNQTAIAVQIAADIRRRKPELTMMIVALYYDQIESIREQLQEGDIADVPVYSFRSVQGNEANLVIFVTTRSNMLLEVGELREELGQVVAGSRSLQGMMIIGHLQTLAGGLEDSAPLKSHIWEIGQSGTVMKGSRWRGESTPGDMVEMPLDEFRDRFIYPRSLDIIIRNFPYQYSPSSLRSLFNAGGVGPRFSDYIQLREGRREEGSYGWLIGGFILRAVSWQDLEEMMQFDRRCIEFIEQGSSPGRIDRRITKQLEAIPWSGTENQREIFDLTFRRLKRTLQDATRLTSILSLRGFHSGGGGEILLAARSALRGLVVRHLELRDIEGEGRMVLATVGDPANDIESSGMMREGLNRSATYLYTNAGRTSYIEINSWFPERQMNISRVQPQVHVAGRTGQDHARGGGRAAITGREMQQF